jgi:hypothetical protein
MLEITCKSRQSFLRNGFMSLAQPGRWLGLDSERRRGNVAETAPPVIERNRVPASIS